MSNSTTELNQLRTGYRRASAIFYTWLMLSIAANFVSGYRPEQGQPAHADQLLTGTLATLWPLALLAAEILLTQIPRLSNPKLDNTLRAIALAVGLIAFAGSAKHIMVVAKLIPGTADWMAWTAPALVDLVMLMAAIISVDLKRRIYDLERTIEESAPIAEPKPVKAIERPVQPAKKATTKPKAAAPSSSKADRHDQIVNRLRTSPMSQADLVAWIMEEFGIATKRTAEKDLEALRGTNRVQSDNGTYSATTHLERVQ